MASNLADRLMAAMVSADGPISITMDATYELAAGVERHSGEAHWNSRLVDGEIRRARLIDSPQSQVIQVKRALRDARDKGELRIPLFEVHIDPERLTALDLPHGSADAYIRNGLIDGTPFEVSRLGAPLMSTTKIDVRPLYERDPYSLLFGVWDARPGGSSIRLPRLYSSEIIGLTAAAEMGKKASGAEISEPPSGLEVRRFVSIPLAGFRQIDFGDSPPSAVLLARSALVALALVGDRLAFGCERVILSSGYELRRTAETFQFGYPNGATKKVAITAGAALRAFHSLRDRAAARGILMSDETVVLQPDLTSSMLPVDPLPAQTPALPGIESKPSRQENAEQVTQTLDRASGVQIGSDNLQINLPWGNFLSRGRGELARWPAGGHRAYRGLFGWLVRVRGCQGGAWVASE
jgi:CRISPR-associated protein Csb1